MNSSNISPCFCLCPVWGPFFICSGCFSWFPKSSILCHLCYPSFVFPSFYSRIGTTNSLTFQPDSESNSSDILSKVRKHSLPEQTNAALLISCAPAVIALHQLISMSTLTSGWTSSAAVLSFYFSSHQVKSQQSDVVACRGLVSLMDSLHCSPCKLTSCKRTWAINSVSQLNYAKSYTLNFTINVKLWHDCIVWSCIKLSRDIFLAIEFLKVIKV